MAYPFIQDYSVFPWHQLTSYDVPAPLLNMPRIFELGQNLLECFLQPMRMIPNQAIPDGPPETPDHSAVMSLHLTRGFFYALSTQLQHLPRFHNLRRRFTLIPLFAKSGARLEVTFGVKTDADTIRTCLTHTLEVNVLQIHRVA
ncbi:unnamed protein product [Cyclocybe aegerita]|uniref:Uncharacterized protein n=1 Tax=Cyclocybe aegerita TaxID=1973307 RepID=A0A8S0WHF7_CYCAE|nr:unnamed protein product [Cyclocybe aegerita]